jgi:hypothetical protein
MSFTRSNFLNTYRTSYSRAITHAIGSGFYARDLDADDVAFIERVRETGCIACGSLADVVPTYVTDLDYRSHRLIEELDFWHFPYAIDPSVERRQSGAAERKAERERLLGGRVVLARKQQHREAERAATKAELAREEADWAAQKAALAKERERRLKQTMEADAEWEASRPHPTENPAPYKPERRERHMSRFYQPIWATEEYEKEREIAKAKAAALIEEMKAERARRKAALAEEQEHKAVVAENQRQWAQRRREKATLEQARQAGLAEAEAKLAAQAKLELESWRDDEYPEMNLTDPVWGIVSQRYVVVSRNPTAVRVIYDYYGRPYVIPPGVTRAGIMLRPKTADDLAKGDLTLTPMTNGGHQ